MRGSPAARTPPFFSSMPPSPPCAPPRRAGTIGVEWLAEGRALGHGHSQDEVLEAGQGEDDCVLVVGQVVGGRNCPVQWHKPGRRRHQGSGNWWGKKVGIGVGTRALNSPGLGYSQEVAPQLHASHQSHLQQQAAEDRYTEQGPGRPCPAQGLGRPCAAHEHCHCGSDDQVNGQKLHVAQVSVDLQAGERAEGKLRPGRDPESERWRRIARVNEGG